MNRKKNRRVMQIGIVGAGLMGSWHARAAKKTGGTIVAVTDSDEEKAKALATKYPLARCFSHVSEMIERETIDVLHICTPTASHYEIAETAINAGINLFIEKPLTMTARQTIRLYDLACENEVQICPAYQFAFQRSVEKAKRILSRVGRLIHLQAIICSAGGIDGSGLKLDEIAADILPHPLSLFQIFLGESVTEEKFDCFRPQFGEWRVEAEAGETSLAIFISLNARPTLNSFQIYGSKGTIRLDLFHDFAFVETGKTSRLRKIWRPFNSSVKEFSAAFFNLTGRAARLETAYPGLQNLINRFYQAVSEKGKPPITPEQAIKVAQIRDYLMLRAAENQTGKRI